MLSAQFPLVFYRVFFLSFSLPPFHSLAPPPFFSFSCSSMLILIHLHFVCFSFSSSFFSPLSLFLLLPLSLCSLLHPFSHFFLLRLLFRHLFRLLYCFFFTFIYLSFSASFSLPAPPLPLSPSLSPLLL